jgi:pentapeptide MXKDX repeat protein
MTFALRNLSLAAVTAITFAAVPAAYAQDAMATDAMATDAMAGDAMMSDEDLKLCLEQAAMITFPHVMDVASAACHDVHNGMMGDAMGGDAMSTDAMATDAMAPATK